MFHGGGPVNASYQLGMIETGSGATVTNDNSILALDAYQILRLAT
jgi:hypothetical protein